MEKAFNSLEELGDWLGTKKQALLDMAAISRPRQITVTDFGRLVGDRGGSPEGRARLVGKTVQIVSLRGKGKNNGLKQGKHVLTMYVIASD